MSSSGSVSCSRPKSKGGEYHKKLAECSAASRGVGYSASISGGERNEMNAGEMANVRTRGKVVGVAPLYEREKAARTAPWGWASGWERLGEPAIVPSV